MFFLFITFPNIQSVDNLLNSTQGLYSGGKKAYIYMLAKHCQDENESFGPSVVSIFRLNISGNGCKTLYGKAHLCGYFKKDFKCEEETFGRRKRDVCRLSA